MGVDIMKQQLLERIQNGNEQLIRVVYAVVEALEKTDEEEVFNEIIAATAPSPDWKPLTKQELIGELEEAMAACDRGEYTTIEELEKEMETW